MRQRERQKERKGEMEVIHGCRCNGHYCKVNVSISHNSHFLQELSSVSLNKNTESCPPAVTVTVMPATRLKCKTDKGGQKWQVANNTAGQLRYWTLDLFYNRFWHRERGFSSELKGNANTVQSTHHGRQHGQIIATNKVLRLRDLRGRMLQSGQNQAFHFLRCWQHQSSILDSLMKSCWLGPREPGLH